MKHTLGILILILLAHSVYSPKYWTGQPPELIIVERDTLSLHNLPLELLRDKNQSIDSLINSYTNIGGCTSWGNQRGYIGVWEAQNDSLYFNSFYSCDKKSLDDFPENRIPAFANWYSDTLRIQEGKLIYYEPNGWNRIYEKEHFWVVENGYVSSKETFENGFSENDTGLYHTELFKILLENINDSIAENYIGESVFFNFNFKNKFSPFSKSQDSKLMSYIQDKIDDLPALKEYRNHQHFPFLGMTYQIKLGKEYEESIFDNLHKQLLIQPDNPFLRSN